MKKSTLLSSVFLVALLLFAGNAFTSSSVFSSPLSGSPQSNGQTCTNCHSGGNTSLQTIMISSDIPPSGFEENTTYNIKIKASGNGGTAIKGGFNATIENANAFAGTISPKTGGGAQVFGNAATHTFSSNSFAGDTLVWEFEWNSGLTNSATVYSTVNFANGNGNTSGDAVKTAVLQLSKSTIGISELEATGISIYPNPASSFIRVACRLEKTDALSIRLFDMNGRIATVFYDGFASGGDFIQSFSLPQLASGNYFIHLESGGKTYSEQISIN